jgi:hypothetical protein
LAYPPEAARQKAMRGRWRRQQGNDGKARVLVDFETNKTVHRSRKRPNERLSEQPDNARMVSALEAHIATLKDALAKTEALAEQRLADIQHEQVRVTELTTELLRLTSQVMASAAERDEARRRADELLYALTALRSQPWWKRLVG